MFARKLQFESLQQRLPFSVQNLIPVELPVKELVASYDIEDAANPASPARYRQLFWSDSESMGLTPRGTPFGFEANPMQVPSGAVDSRVEMVLGQNSALGVGRFDDSLEVVLWIDVDRSVRLGRGIPLAGMQMPDRSFWVAYESENTVHVLRFNTAGIQLESASYDANLYSNVHIGREGLVLWGKVDSIPMVILIEPNRTSRSLSLELPTGAISASIAGIGSLGLETTLVGNVLDGNGETRVVAWNREGGVILEGSSEGVWATESSGSAWIVNTSTGDALVLHEGPLASALGILPGEMVPAKDIPILKNSGLMSARLTSIVAQGEQLFVGVSGTDNLGQLKNSLLVASTEYFESPWQNRANPVDVNSDRFVTPLDALLVINWLNAHGASSLNEPDQTASTRIDVSGDGLVTPLDALRVLNHLNARLSGDGEGEMSEPARYLTWADSDAPSPTAISLSENEPYLTRCRKRNRRS